MSAHAQNHSPSGSERENDRAAEALPDRTRFEIEAKDWAQFQAALDAPPRDLPRLASLLTRPSVFER